MERTLFRDKAVQTRVTADEFDLLDRIARADGCSISDLLRRALYRTFQLSSAGTNGSEMEERANGQSITAQEAKP